MMQVPIPDELWDELRSAGLLVPDAPTPRLDGIAGIDSAGEIVR